MTNFQKIITEIVNNDPQKQIGVAEKLGITDAYVSNFVTGTRPVSSKVAKKMEQVYGISANELLAIRKREEADALKPTGLSSYTIQQKPTTVNEPSKTNVSTIPYDDYMEVEFVDLSVQAGPLGGHALEELPKSKKMLVPREYDRGEYLVLRVDGNSMYKKDSDISIPAGTEILVKKFYLENGDQLPIRNNLFVIDAKDGQALKQITMHDVEKGFIRCHSYNDDYKDYDVRMEDVLQIFIYRKVVSSRPPIPDINS